MSTASLQQFDESLEPAGSLEEDDFISLAATSNFEIALRSRDSQVAWKGVRPTGENRGHPGINWFCRKVGHVCKAAYVHDDPYAISHLLQLENKLSEIEDGISQASQNLREKTPRQTKSLKYAQPLENKYDVLRESVTIRNGYALRALTLISEFDDMAVLSLDLSHIAAISRTTARNFRNIAPFRSLIGHHMAFVSKLNEAGTTGCSRMDILDGGARSASAYEVYGEVDAAVLESDFELQLMELNPNAMKNPDA